MSRATVFFHVNDEVLSLEVDLINDTIGSLFPDRLSSQFLFNQRPLLFAFTLAYYGVTDGSHIYVIDKPQKPKKVAPFKRTRFVAPIEAVDLTTRRDWFLKQFGVIPPPAVMQQVVDTMTDQGLAAEVSRLRDLFFRKIEGTTRNYKRLMKLVASGKCHDDKVVSSSPVLAPPAVSPSTAELPVLWSELA